jgi:hypothetical protein
MPLIESVPKPAGLGRFSGIDRRGELPRTLQSHPGPSSGSELTVITTVSSRPD